MRVIGFGGLSGQIISLDSLNHTNINALIIAARHKIPEFISQGCGSRSMVSGGIGKFGQKSSPAVLIHQAGTEVFAMFSTLLRAQVFAICVTTNIDFSSCVRNLQNMAGSSPA